jgi:glutathione peroxidase
MNVHDFTVAAADGSDGPLRDFDGRVLLVVNVASKCGLTTQYEGLEALYRDAWEGGLEILGFPFNQFGEQEPGTDTEIQEFCRVSYDVTFPVMRKVDVNGPDAEPLFAYLRAEAPGDFRPRVRPAVGAHQQEPARDDRHGRRQVELHEVPHRPRRPGGRPLRAHRDTGGDPG